MTDAGLSVDDDLLERLAAYYELLTRWNDTINLAGMELRDAGDPVLDRIIVEPLLAAAAVRHPVNTMIDVGSGGGSPAIPMALALGTDLRMVESRSRKAVFLREAARTVGLSNVDVRTGRFEALCSEPALTHTHDLATIRAVRLDEGTVNNLKLVVKRGGQVALFRPSSDLLTFDTAESRLPLGLSAVLVTLTA